MLDIPSNRKDLKEYRIWKAMNARCSAPCLKNKSYQKKGITVSSEWKDFVVFYNDMGKIPSKNHSIDRIDNNGNYCKENCRWATASEQTKNRGSFNIIYNYNGEPMVLKDIAKKVGMKYTTLYQRIFRNNMTLEEALSLRLDNAKHKLNGKMYSLSFICKHINIKYTTIQSYMRRGNKTLDEALEYYNIKSEDIVQSIERSIADTLVSDSK